MRTIAIPFELSESWMGGAYYIRNLASAMRLLPAEEQPYLVPISERADSVQFLRESGYPHIGWVSPTEFEALAKEKCVDAVFLHPIAGQAARTISWIPDFQELHLGYFFADDEIARRRDHHRRRFATAGLVVSSEDVRKDVNTFYPGECANVSVVRFASFDTPGAETLETLRQRYDLPERYVFCANQVWVHKNHIVVIRAVALLKAMGIDVTVVFTGNEDDYRVAGYAGFLKSQAEEWGIMDRVRFLGFIPRSDQLGLMQGSRYIVQPSLFEGWSTVIEDAKSLGKFIVASDLAVHKEQLTEACAFFFRHDPLALAEVMAQIEHQDRAGALPARASDYDEARRRFARDLMQAVERFLPAGGEVDTAAVLSRMRALSEANLARLAQTPQTPAPASAPKKSVDPAAAKAAAAATTAQAMSNFATMPKSVPKGLTISLDDRGEALKILMIFTERALMLNRKYDKFLLKFILNAGQYQVELRESSIVPPIVTDKTSDGKDSYGHFLRIPLSSTKAGAPMTGTVSNLSEAVIADINAMIEGGLVTLRENIRDKKLQPSSFLTTIAAGARLSRAT
ncbi:glycosyltransferase [Rhodobacter lacus]|uniref:Glycosyltransferase n=1 Tax=Rhodobacter lacus TaxID=1641972 RepID=A0ABW5A7C9_9RHOB